MMFQGRCRRERQTGVPNFTGCQQVQFGSIDNRAMQVLEKLNMEDT